MNHKISVIIPVYNQEKHIKRCIESVRNQTYYNIEIILVDDGSTDKSGIICDYFARIDSRITVVHKTNKGVSSARNAGLDICSGKYVTFVDSDDFVSAHYVEYLYYAICQLNVKAAWCAFASVKGEEIDMKQGKQIENLSYRIVNAFLEYNYGNQYILRHNCTAMFERTTIQDTRFSLNIAVGEDALFNAQIINDIQYFGFVDEKLYYYVQYDDSASHSTFGDKRATAIDAWTEIIKTYNNRDFRFLQGCYISLARVCKEGLQELIIQDVYDQKIYNKLINALRVNLYHILKSSIPTKEKISIVICCINPRWLILLRSFKRRR